MDPPKAVSKRVGRFQEILESDLAYIDKRNKLHAKGISDKNLESDTIVTRSDKYFTKSVRNTGRNCNQGIHFTRTEDSSERISFLHWMMARVHLKDIPIIPPEGGSEAIREAKKLDIEQKKAMINGLTKYLGMYHSEVADRCENVHKLGRGAWHSMVSLTYVLKDFCIFCTQDFSDMGTEKWAVYLRIMYNLIDMQQHSRILISTVDRNDVFFDKRKILIRGISQSLQEKLKYVVFTSILDAVSSYIKTSTVDIDSICTDLSRVRIELTASEDVKKWSQKMAFIMSIWVEWFLNLLSGMLSTKNYKRVEQWKKHEDIKIQISSLDGMPDYMKPSSVKCEDVQRVDFFAENGTFKSIWTKKIYEPLKLLFEGVEKQANAETKGYEDIPVSFIRSCMSAVFKKQLLVLDTIWTWIAQNFNSRLKHFKEIHEQIEVLCDNNQDAQPSVSSNEFTSFIEMYRRVVGEGEQIDIESLKTSMSSLGMSTIQIMEKMVLSVVGVKDQDDMFNHPLVRDVFSNAGLSDESEESLLRLYWSTLDIDMDGAVKYDRKATKDIQSIDYASQIKEKKKKKGGNPDAKERMDTKHTMSNKPFKEVMDTLRRMVPIILTLKMESETHTRILEKHVTSQDGLSLADLRNIDPYHVMSGSKKEPWEDHEDVLLRLLQRGCLVSNVNGKRGRQLMATWKVNDKDGPGNPRWKIDQLVGYRKSIYQRIMERMGVRGSFTPSFKQIYNPWSGWRTRSNLVQKNIPSSYEGFYGSIVLKRYEDIPTAGSKPPPAPTTNTKMSARVKRTNTTMEFTDLQIPGISSSGKIHTKSLMYDPIASIRDNLKSKGNIKDETIGKKKLIVFKYLRTSANDPLKWVKDCIDADSQTFRCDVRLQVGHILQDINKFMQDPANCPPSGSEAMSSVRLESTLGTIDMKDILGFMGEYMDQGEGGNFYNGNVVDIGNDSLENTTPYIKELGKKIYGSMAASFKRLRKAYNDLANLEYFHRNLSLSTADSIRMLTDVSDCLNFLLDKFGCDAWVNDVHVLNMSSNKHEMDLREPINIARRFEDEEDAQEYMNGIVRRDPWVKVTCNLPNMRKIISRFDSTEYKKDVNLIREVIAWALHTKNDLKDVDDESDVRNLCYIESLDYDHACFAWNLTILTITRARRIA